jgi:hypothetical protein
MAVGEAPDYVIRNRASWDGWASEYEQPGRINWAQDEPSWGIWSVPESELHVLPDSLEIDLSQRRPQLLTRELAERADVVVTMSCGDECPFIPGKRYIDWEPPIPKAVLSRSPDAWNS